MADVYRAVLRDLKEQPSQSLKPTGFYTDSGLVGTNMWYSFHNIFDTNVSNMYGGYVFSSNSGKNNHIQYYLCQPCGGVDNPFCQKLKKEYEIGSSGKEIMVPYKRYPDDGSMPTFKVPKSIEINCKNMGYWYYTDNILLSFSEAEVDNKKYKESIKFFSNFKNVAEVEESGIPILNKDTSQDGFVALEFDLSKKSRILELMKIKKFVSIPLVYLNVDKNKLNGKNPIYEFQQNIAAKYMSMNLICWSTAQGSNQLDMFPCTLKGKHLNFS